MTIAQAWTIVLDRYHDDLPPELQWRPGMKCAAPSLNCPQSVWTKDGVGVTHDHDIPQPTLTDAAAMAVLRVLSPLRLQRTWEISDKPWSVKFSHSVIVVSADDPRDAIILAAADLAQKERAK